MTSPFNASALGERSFSGKKRFIMENTLMAKDSANMLIVNASAKTEQRAKRLSLKNAIVTNAKKP